MTITVMRNADWVVAWDEGTGRHVYRRNLDIAFSGDRIVFVGRNYGGAADEVVDGKDRLVLPGLIDIHSHPEHEPLYRGVREEHGLRNMHMTGLYERSQAFYAPDDEARAASAELAYCELLLSGVTSLVDISPVWDGWLELFARSGMRGFLARATPQPVGVSPMTSICSLPGTRSAGATTSRLRWGSSIALSATRAAGCPGSSRRCRLTPAPTICCGTAMMRQTSATTLHRAYCAERQRGAGNDPAPRQDADPMGLRD